MAERHDSDDDAPRPQVVIVEDERSLRELYGDVLRSRGMSVEVVGTVGEAERLLSRHAPDVLLLDVRLPDGDGLVLLERLRQVGVRAPVVVMTAHGTVERAVQALRAGAVDFLVKPFDNDLLAAAVESALEAGRRLVEVEFSAGRVRDVESTRELVGAAGGLREVVELLPRVASSSSTVLLRGESGTGKEVVARAIHAASPRMDGPFVAVNCAALPPGLLESELFGFERGAFTGAHQRRKGLVEAADGGTLFLDEIGDMTLEAQARLLRVLQERQLTRLGGRDVVTVDIRVIAATHRDLETMVQEGRFRQDLLYRLAVVPMDLPPLRERKQDLPGLLDHFLAKHARRQGKPVPRPDQETMRRVVAYAWPGNVRELENLAERAVVLGAFPVDALLAEARTHPPTPLQAPVGTPVTEVTTLREAVAQAERAAVVAALRRSGGNKAQAARVLGVSYKTLFNKMHEHAIQEDVSIA
jgi:DNA-binding NtrC family response regulator